MTAAAAHDGPLPPQTDAGARQTLLVVEDDVLARSAICATLRDAGYTVLEAATADEALSVLRTVPVDLLFVDVHLHGEGDGVSVARFARRKRPRVKVVFTSGKITPEQAPDVEGLGPFLAKPYLFSRVIRLVQQALAGPGDGPAGAP